MTWFHLSTDISAIGLLSPGNARVVARAVQSPVAGDRALDERRARVRPADVRDHDLGVAATPGG